MQLSNGTIDEKRLALATRFLENMLLDMGMSMDAETKAKAVSRVYLLTGDDICIADMQSGLREIFGGKEA